MACTGWLHSAAQAQGRAAAPYFQDEATASRTALGAALLSSRPLVLDLAGLRAALTAAPTESRPGAAPLVVALPLPDGSSSRFAVVETALMAPALAAQFPQIKTYRGVGLDDPTASVRLDVTPRGFHAQILSAQTGTVYIDPSSRTDSRHYLSFYRRDMNRTALGAAPVCQFKSTPTEQAQARQRVAVSTGPAAAEIAAGTSLRTYRLAVAATGEYTAFRGGTVALALSGIVTTVNRVVGVYEKEVAVRLQLVGNNANIIYTNAATDPYSNGNPGAMINEAQTNITSLIGTANFDIGHVFGTNSGGLAGLGVVCNASNKARGVTGSGSPVGDAFDIDYVAHEIGHQFGADHSFNTNQGACAGNGNTSTAFEPGSGSTIMAYAGICAPDDLQANSDAYFHSGSFQEILTFIATTSCGTSTATGNTAPLVTVPTTRTLPIGTPFRLTASATDAQNDVLTYNWEQMNGGPFAALSTPQVANSNVPLFRSFTPSTSPTRYFPRLSNLVSNTSSTAERLPTVTRSMRFRCTVRDQHNGAAGVVGGVDYSTDVNLSVTSAAGPFLVTAPNTAVTWTGGSAQTVTWNVAGTSANGVNCATVNILLSTDGGLTYPTTLVSGTANDGSVSVTVPSVATSTARIMVAAADNYFFDISNANFSITAPTACAAPTGLSVGSITQTTASVSFTASASATGYTVTTTPASSTQNVTAGPVTLSGLTPGTAYSVNIVSNCAGGTTSTAATAAFSTAAPPPCNAPTNLAAGSITANSAVISFTPNGTSSSYTVTTFPATTTQTITASPVTLSGLTGATNYTVSIVGNCPDGVTSAPGTLAFATRVANDECATAINLVSAISCVTTSGTVTGATQSQGPSTCNGATGTSALDVWYSFTATGPTHTVTTNSAFDGVLQLFSGSCGSLTSLGCRDANVAGGESITVNGLTAGTRYFARYYAYTDAGTPQPANGNFTICVTGPVAPSCNAPTALAVNSITQTTASVSFTPSATATGYTVTTTPASSTQNVTAGPVTLSGLTPGTAYSVNIVSNCAGGTTSTAATAAFSTAATPATAAPVLLTPANGSLTSDNTPTYSGTAPASSTVTVFVDGSSIGTTTAAADGNWTLTAVSALTDGPHTAYATAQSSGATISPNSNTNTFTVDTTPPPAPLVAQPANGSQTNDNTPLYGGTAQAGSTVTVLVDGSSIGTTTATGAGAWSFTQPTALTSGSHTVRARATDAVGNTSPDSNTNTFTVDTTAPTVALSSTTGASGSSTLTTPFVFSATFSENVSGFAVSGISVSNGTVSSGPTASTATTYTFQVTPTTPGTATTVSILAGAAQDGAGNGNAASAAYSLTYTVPVTSTTWTGNVSTDWFTAANWTNGVPTATLDAAIPGAAASMPLISAGTALTRSLTIGSGATLSQTGGTLEVHANLTNNGSFVPTGGTVVLGSTAQANGSNILGNSRVRFWNLTVNANGVLLSTSVGASARRLVTLNGTLVTQSNPFVLESDANNTALVVNNGGLVQGTATAQRYITPDLNAGPGYRHVSAPTGNATVNSLSTAGFSPTVNAAYNSSATPTQVSPFPTVFGYDQSRLASATSNLSAFDKGWASPAGTTDALTVGKAYTVNMPAGQTLSFTGALNNGTLAQILTRNSGATAADAGWQLVGNPYPAPLDYSLVAAADRSNLDAAIYIFESTSQYGGNYRSYVNGVGGNPILPLGQGFFVRVSAGQTSGSLNFRNSQRVTSYQNPVFQRSGNRPLVHLTLRGATAALKDDSYVYFEAGATPGFDAQYDALKIQHNSGGAPTLFSLTETTELSINGLPLLTGQTVVPLGIAVPQAGTFTFVAAELLNLTTASVYLHDAQTGQDINLQQQPNYSFTTSAAGLLTTRFSLRFEPQRPTSTTSASALQFSVWPNPAAQQARLNVALSQPVTRGTLTLRDVLGRTLSTQGFSGTQTTVSTTGLATGTYLLVVEAPNHAPITRRVVVE
ncbi:hypothetical protein GCM10023186_05400 [Hymenobacter koreensis]|uniref:Fibronectin type-III domain-containing protein n=1 Tax=Hymenobacter koreensis TaxID=1084523 RepID=A0ABP8IUY3_9BACT